MTSFPLLQKIFFFIGYFYFLNNKNIAKKMPEDKGIKEVNINFVYSI